MLSHLNFKEHPTDKKYMVYIFSDYNKAAFFEHLLIKEHLHYEKHFDPESKTYYFGTLKKQDDKIKKINDLTRIKYKQPFIPYKSLRIFLLFLFFLLLTLAIAGYIKSHA